MPMIVSTRHLSYPDLATFLPLSSFTPFFLLSFIARQLTRMSWSVITQPSAPSEIKAETIPPSSVLRLTLRSSPPVPHRYTSLVSPRVSEPQCNIITFLFLSHQQLIHSHCQIQSPFPLNTTFAPISYPYLRIHPSITSLTNPRHSFGFSLFFSHLSIYVSFLLGDLKVHTYNLFSFYTYIEIFFLYVV